MVEQLKFFWLRLREAGRGSIDIANAWQGLLGTFILFAYGYWRGGAVMIPDKVDEYALVFTFACLAIAWLCVFAFQLAGAPAKLYWAERADNKRLAAELKIARRDTTDDQKWKIEELFHYIDPDYLENNSWQRIGDDLRDALSAGRLTMWGRLKETALGTWVGPRDALKPIESAYWYKAYFTYFFFAEGTVDGVHVYADRKTGRPAYTDLQVSRSEALAAFPGEPDDVAENYANVRIADNPSIHEKILRSGERQKFLGLLSSGVLTAWARPMQGRSDFVRVPKTQWETHYIDVRLKYEELIENNNAPTYINQSFLKTRNNNEPTHYDVCVNRAQMSRIWKDMHFVRDKGRGA